MAIKILDVSMTLQDGLASSLYIYIYKAKSIEEGDIRAKHRSSLTHSLIHSLIHSLTHSLTHSLIHSIKQASNHPLTHSLIHPLTHLLTHSIQWHVYVATPYSYF